MADKENQQQQGEQLAGGVAAEKVPETTAIEQINDGVEKVVLTTDNQKKKNKKKVFVYWLSKNSCPHL